MSAARLGAARANAQDFQVLLARTVARLAEATGATRVVAWGRDRKGGPSVLAARLEGTALLSPDEPALRIVGALTGPMDLGDPHASPELRALATEHGFAAAAPVSGGGPEPVAVLLLGGMDGPGNVRPRTLAELSAAADRLDTAALAENPWRKLDDLDAQVQRLDRLATLGGLVAEIVHEIRNPLVSVKTFLQLLPEHVDDPEFHGEFLDVSLEEVRRIERLLNLVLENARPSAATSEEVIGADVGTAIESVVQLLSFRAADRGIELASAVPEGLPRPTMEADPLRQVLMNLTLNALEVTPNRGTVALAVRALGDTIEIDVEDEGPGVPLALRTRLFEPFFSTKEDQPGGLGLGISRRLTEEAGGRIEVHDATSGGSIFRVSLPRADR